MRRISLFYDADIIQYIIISKQYDGETIKDFRIHYKKTSKDLILSLLRGFVGKTITISDLQEKLLKDEIQACGNELHLSSWRISDKLRKPHQHFIEKQSLKYWEDISWREYQRKYKKEK